MLLRDLYQHFCDQDDASQRVFVARYRARRAAEFEADKVAFEAKTRRSGATKRQPALVLSPEEKILMQKLGLTQKQLRALRALEE